MSNGARCAPLRKQGFDNFVGGGEENETKEELHYAIKGFSKYLSLDIKKGGILFK